MFESNSDKVDAENKKAQRSSDRLDDALEKNNQSAQEFGRNFVSNMKAAAASMATLLAAGYSFSSIMEQANETASLARTAEALGEQVSNLDAFSRAVETIGGDADMARDSLTDMSESIGEALQDVESQRAKTFNALGVSLRDVQGNIVGPIEGMERLAESVQGLSRNEAVFRIKELGITDNRIVELILSGRKAIEGMIGAQKDMGVTTNENAQDAIRFSNAMVNLRNQFRSIGLAVSTTVLPALTWIIDRITAATHWMDEHRRVVGAAFSVIAGIITAVYLPAAIRGAAATWAMIGPYVAVGAAIAAVSAALALAYDDIMTFIEGGDSMIGQVSDRWPIIGTILKVIIDAIQALGGLAMVVFNLFSDLINDPANALSNFADNVESVMGGLVFGGEQVKKVWNDVIGIVTDGIETVMNGVDKVVGVYDAAKSKISGVGRSIAGAWDSTVDFFGGDDDLPAAQSMIGDATASPIGSMSSQAIMAGATNNTRSTSVRIDNVQINTQATDADGISAEIGQSLTDHIRGASADIDDGVSY